MWRAKAFGLLSSRHAWRCANNPADLLNRPHARILHAFTKHRKHKIRAPRKTSPFRGCFASRASSPRDRQDTTLLVRVLSSRTRRFPHTRVERSMEGCCEFRMQRSCQEGWWTGRIRAHGEVETPAGTIFHHTQTEFAVSRTATFDNVTFRLNAWHLQINSKHAIVDEKINALIAFR
jgi:hypothetical protein